MFNNWQEIEITENDVAVKESGKKLLDATERYFASNGAEKDSNDLSDQVGEFVAELLIAASNKRAHWTLRLWTRLKNVVRSGLRQ